MRKLFSILLVAALASCDNKTARQELINETEKGPKAVLGTWQRSMEYRDPGNGNGSWAATSDGTLTFEANGKFRGVGHPTLERFDSYKVFGDEVHFYAGPSDSTQAWFIANEKELQLNFKAREAMQDRYYRIR